MKDSEAKLNYCFRVLSYTTHTMLSRIGFNAAKSFSRVRPNVRLLTTSTTITDHITGKVITLSDPKHPEMADYPNPKPEFAQHRDPNLKYDDPQNRRNFNEPLNFDADMYDMWSPEYHSYVDDKSALLYNGVFFGLVAAFAGVIWYFELNPGKPAMPRSYPFNGLAKDLGASGSEDAEFYRVRPDNTAEEQLGLLPEDADVASNKKLYKEANKDYITA